MSRQDISNSLPERAIALHARWRRLSSVRIGGCFYCECSQSVADFSVRDFETEIVQYLASRQAERHPGGDLAVDDDIGISRAGVHRVDDILVNISKGPGTLESERHQLLSDVEFVIASYERRAREEASFSFACIEVTPEGGRS